MDGPHNGLQGDAVAADPSRRADTEVAMRLADRALLVLGAIVVGLPALAVDPVMAAAPPAPLAAAAVRPAVSEVVGYLPTWELPRTPASSLRYDVLTTIALFDVPVRPDGSLDRASDAYRGVMGAAAGAVIRAAHAAGDRVVITFSSFGSAANTRLLRPAARGRLVREAVALVAARGADGVDLDLEGVRAADVAAYGALAGAMSAAVHRAHAAGRVSVATEANPVGARMAAAAVAGGADRAFVMTYAMRTASSTQPGSIDPLDRPGSPYSILGALDMYLVAGVPRSRTILGVPFYGLTWATTGPGPGARARGTGSIVLASRLPKLVPEGARAWRDAQEATSAWSWYDRRAGTWRQAFVDDAASIAARVRYALGRGLAGTGFWALGYERGQAAYWSAIATAATSRRVSGASGPGATASAGRAGGDAPGPGPAARDHDAPAVVSLSVRWDGAGRRWVAAWAGADAGSGIARYRVVYQVGTGLYRTLAGGLTTGATIHAPRSVRVRVAVQAFDAAGNGSAWRYATGQR